MDDAPAPVTVTRVSPVFWVLFFVIGVPALVCLLGFVACMGVGLIGSVAHQPTPAP